METFFTESEQDTFSRAQALGRTLKPGTFVLLYGDLGAGKTAFVKGLAAGLGIDPEEVTSPTFVLVQHYKGVTPLIHVDLYRLDTPAAIHDLGLDELVDGAVVAVEWAERLPEPIPGSVAVRIVDAGGSRRAITFEP